MAWRPESCLVERSVFGVDAERVIPQLAQPGRACLSTGFVLLNAQMSAVDLLGPFPRTIIRVSQALERIGERPSDRCSRTALSSERRAQGRVLMRVLYLNAFSRELSGPDESLRTLLGQLVPMGVEAHVVLPVPGPQVERYRQLGAAVHIAPLAAIRRNLSLATAAYPIQLLVSAARVGGIARRIAPDVIHTNTEALLEGALAARATRIPHVLHYRGNTNDEPKWVFNALTATWNATADRIYCISHATAAVFARHGRMDKVEVLYNPVDVAQFASAARSDEVRASLGARGAVRLIGTVGRIHPRKDMVTFLRAAADIARRAPDTHFAIIGNAEGDGEHEYERRLRALVGELALEHRVTFAGARRDIPAVMASLDVFMLTSRHEGFGRVVAEAMAAARPMVVSDEGAPPELVEAERHGLVARPGDAADFARQVERLLANAELARALGARAAERARLFEPRASAIRVKTCYEELLAARSQQLAHPIRPPSRRRRGTPRSSVQPRDPS